MARGKKKESALTPEEKLEQALVPDWEHPYKVPKNWQWVVLKSCCIDFFSGKSPKYSKAPTDIKIIGQQANRRDGIDLSYVKFGTVEFAEAQEERMWLQKNDVLLNTLGSGTIGRSGIYKGNERLLTDGHLFVFRSNECYLPDLMYYYLCANEEKIINSANGSTNQKFLSLSSFSEFPLPVPPIAEQQRIVDRIEYLFAKLDEAKENAQSVLDSFETRKAAILHKAFAGELTAKWRAEHGISDDTWVGKPLADFLQLITYGFTNPMPDADEGPWKITAKSVHDGYIDYEISRKTTQEAFDNLLTDKSRPLVNDVLLTKDGSIGRVAVVDRPGICINQSVALLRPTEAVRPEFLRDMLLSPQHQRTMELQAGGTALKHIYITRVDKMVVSVPSVIEQEEVCKIVKSLMTKEQQAKEAAEVVLEKIDLLKKSILARALRGELGTNDPTEESSVELIKSMLSEKIPKDKPKGKREKEKPEVEFVAKTIMQALSAGGKITPEKLKSETGLLIDDFYDQLKTLIDSGCVIETRIDGESYLEAKNEDRQPNN